MNKLLIASSCALLLTATPTFAASVYRCTDEAGNVTFTRQGCPPDHTTLNQDVTNPTPSSNRVIPLARPRERGTRKSAATELTVVGVQDDGCGNHLTGSAKRNAMVRQQILPGMTRADIENFWNARCRHQPQRTDAVSLQHRQGQDANHQFR